MNSTENKPATVQDIKYFVEDEDDVQIPPGIVKRLTGDDHLIAQIPTEEAIYKNN